MFTNGSQKRHTAWLISVLIVVVVTVLGVLPALAVEPTAQLTPGQVYDAVSPSVVAINVVVTRDTSSGGMQIFPQQGNQPNNPNTPQQPDNEQRGYGSGSGFVIDQAGHIVTNAHVVEDAVRIEVNFIDGTQVRGEIVGVDTGSDIAVIKVDLPAEKLIPVTWGDSSLLDEGQEVVAIGSPFGQRWTLTDGIISALERSISGLTQFSIGGVIQTDAAINPGNSGGPLLDMSGAVIGVNSQISTTTGGSVGIGYAIPANLVKRVAEALIADGTVSYSYLGIQGGNVDLALIETLNLPNDMRGVVVSEVTNGGPAALAGIQSAGRMTQVEGLDVPQQVDIITAINGEPLTGISDLIGYLATYTQPGDTVKLDVLRNGTERLQLDVQLTPRPTQ